MAQQLFEGTFQQGKVIDAELGKSGKMRVRWNLVVLDDGPHKGKVASYSGKLDPENIKFTKRDMIAAGWLGKDVRTFADDVKQAARIVPFTAEIASFKRDDGSVSEWTAARMGSVAKPLEQLDSDEVRKVNEWFANAGDLEPQNKDSSTPF